MKVKEKRGRETYGETDRQRKGNKENGKRKDRQTDRKRDR